MARYPPHPGTTSGSARPHSTCTLPSGRAQRGRHRWTLVGKIDVFRAKSGYAGPDIGAYTQPGSNGLTFDPQGRLVICQHGNRRVLRIEPHGNTTVLADRYQGKRLNSPNDLVYRSDGA